MTLRRLLLVVVGGMLGSAARLAVGLWLPDHGGFPVAILAVNASGALLLGMLSARVPASTDLRVFLGTGILGGFTTYSALTVGAVGLWSSAPWLAAGYAIASLALGILAAAAGTQIAAPRGRRR
ncbi:fluoride efflux transporter FluC [Microbacterium sp. GXF0217]